jgi:hypothetical protein
LSVLADDNFVAELARDHHLQTWVAKGTDKSRTHKGKSAQSQA